MAEVILVILDALILMNTVIRLKTSIPDVGMQINIIVYSM